ncbi:VCBS domain-containing protein [Aestuariispira ectoiniformans]|uniref:VCBS domain-containing protein n=1 Tax=Aestuariispira ectoiniformans TaxID=2775080 RepID=UPI00223A716C|nr:VCBS domain-containing protein [Aestuariispira ectoiniformans]
MAVTPEGNETNATPVDQNPGQGHAGQSPFAVASDNLAELLARAIVVGHPDVGGEDTYVIEPGQPLKFTFSLDDVQIIQADGDIILAFDDGGQVTFTTMVAAAFSDNPPVLLMPDGQALSAEVLLDKAMDISQLAEGLAGLETASGPASGAPATNYAETLGGFGEGGFGDVPPLPPVNVVSSLGTVPPLRGFNDGGDSGSGGNNGGGDNGGLGPLPPLPAVIAGDDSGSVTEDNVLKVGGNLTVTDQNAGEAVFDGVSEPGKYGLLTITEDGAWEYSLNNDATAIQQLPEGQTLTDTVTVQSADGTTHEITITITGTNDVPVITGDVAGSVAEDTTLTTSGTLTGDDVDLNEDGFQPQTDTAGDYGNFSIDADGNWTYDLTANDDPAIQGLGVGDSLTETFTVISKDGTATETVTVTIEGTNDAPVVAPVNEDNVDDGTAVFSVAEDNSLIITSADLLANSSDVDGDDLSVVNLQADNGTLVDNGDGTWTFTPGENFNGKVNLTFGVNDGHVTTDATGTIRVTPVADAAEISGADTGGTVEDTTLTASGSLAVVDPDTGESFVQPQTDTAGDYGNFSIDADGNWTYDLTGNDSDIVQGLGEGETLTEVFTVRSLDGTEHDVTVTIEGTNDAPVVSGPIADNMDEDGGSITFTSDDLLANVSDVDVNDTHTVSNVQVDGGAIVDNGDGTWTFTPDENFNGEVNLTYDVSDGTATVPASGTITVNAVADAAQISGDDTGATVEDTTLTATGSLAVADPDAGEAVFNTDPVNGTYGSLTITEGGDWEYSLNNDAAAIQALPAGEQLTDTVTVTSADGTEHDITITITGTNDVPEITGDAAGSVAEDASTLTTSGTLTAADTDTGESFVQPQTDTAGDYGNFSIDADGNWTYDLTANDDPTIQGLGVGDSLTESFTVTSQDGTATETVTVTIEGTNDAPVVSGPIADNMDEDSGSITFTSDDLLANVSDVDVNDTHTVSNVQVDGGAIVDNGDGTWTFTPDENFNGEVNLTYDVSDGTATVPASGTITVDAVADAAQISGDDTGATVEDTTLTATGSLAVADPDAGEAVFNTDPVNGTYGSLTITEGGDWEYSLNNDAAAIQALPAGEQLTDTVTVTSADGTEHDITITITGTNDVPEITGDAAGSVAEDASTLTTSGTLTAADTDTGESFVQPQTDTAGDYGNFSIDADGNWTYDLTANDDPAVQGLGEGESLTETFTVTSQDGTATETVTVTIEGTNDAPVVSGMVTETMDEDGGSITFTSDDLLANVSDVDVNDTHTVSNVQVDGGAIVDNGDGTWTFTPDENFNGEVNLTYDVSDGTATVPASGTITVNAVADAAQISGDDTGATVEDTTLTATGSLAVADPDAGEAVFNTDPVNGTYGSLTITEGGDWEYSLNNDAAAIQALPAGEQLTDTVTVTSADGTEHDITITITGTNDVPQITGDVAGSVAEDATTLSTSGTLTAADTDTGESFVQPQTDTAGDYGNFSIDADGNWTYDLTANDDPAVQGLGVGDSLTESFTVTSQDGTATETVTVTIEGTNDAPVVSGPIADNMDEDGGSITFTSDDLLANVSDVDVNDTHTVSNVQVDGGAIVDNGDGTWTFTPDENFNGEVNLTYDVSDGTATVPASGTITVDAVADAAQISGDDTGAIVEDTTLTATGSLAVADPDAGEAVFNTDPVNGTYGSLTITEGGDWEYSLNNDAAAIQALPAGEQLTDTVTVTSADGTTHDVTITITGTNDVPQITGDAAGSVAEDASTLTTSGTLTAADTDTGESFVQPQTDTAGDYGNFSIDADGNWTYDLTANDDPTIQGLGVGDSLTESFTVTSQDGTATETVTVTIEGTNDAPVVAPVNADNEDDGTAVFSMAEDHTLTITSADLLANSSDVDGDDLSVVNLQADNGTVVDNGDGTWSFTPGENFNGKVNLTFGVNDGHVTTDANGTIRVTPVADMPTVTTAEATGVEDHAVDLNVGAELTDGSEALTVTISGVPDGATLTGGIDLGGGVWSVDPGQLDSLKLNPPTDFSGEIEMTLHATSTESNGDSKTATDSFKVYVAPDADALSLNVADVTADTGPAMGTDASEVITGTQGADALYGGGGDDVIVSYGGGDYVVGDESGVGGNFTADLSIAADGGDSDGSEVLTVTIDGLPDGASLSAGTQQPDGSWHLSTADLAGLSVSGPAGAGDFDLTVTLTTVDSESDRGGTDTDSVSKTIHVSVEGGAGEAGVAGADNISTGSGDDTVYGDYTTVSQDASEGGRGDVISTGAGDDFVVGGLGADNISTGADDDIVYGDRYGTDWTGAQAAHESSKDGGDNINTGSGDDTVYAMGGDDNVTAGDGNDTVYAGDGSDTVHGGDGNDMIVGDTTAVASPEPAAITSITANVAMSGRGTAGTFRVFVNGEYAGTYQTDVKKTHDGDSDAISIDGLHLQPGTEPTITIIPVADKSQIWVDSIEVGGKVYEAETDATYTHAKEMGDYVKLQHGGSITFTVGDDAFTSAGGAGGQDAVANDDQLYGGSGNDVIFGDTGDLGETTGGNDRVDGGAGDDRLYGEGGNDTVVGGTGRDWISGGADNGHVTVSATEITLHFQSSDAGYDNSFGYFIMDEDGNPTIGQVLWTDVNDGGSETIDLNGIDPANIGYFIIPDGDNQNSGFWDGAEVTFHQNGDGEWTAYLNGQPLDGQGAPAYFSGDGSLNPDGMVHVNIGDDGQISFEDLYGGGDSDFNDVVMGSETTQEVTDSANGDHLWGGEEGGHEVSVSDQLLETGEVASDHDATGADQAYLSSHGILSDGGVEAGQVLSIWNAGDEENSSYRISWGDGDYRYVTVEAGKETYVLMDGHDAGMAYTLEAADGNGGWEDVSTVVSGSDYDSSLNSTMVNVMGDGEQDVFFFKEGDGFDTIHDFEVGVDQLVISGYDADDMSFHTDGNDTVITLGDQGDGLRLIGVDASDITGDDNVAHYDADTNHDGSLSVDEVVDMREQIFDDSGQSDAPDAHDTSIVFVAPVEPGLNPENNGEDPPQS